MGDGKDTDYNPQKPVGLDTDTIESTVKTLLSNLITREFNSPVDYLRTSHVRAEPPSRPPLHPL
eukprot:9117110-Pyramimonas_sp.AAC.1